MKLFFTQESTAYRSCKARKLLIPRSRIFHSDRLLVGRGAPSLLESSAATRIIDIIEGT